MNLGLIIGLSVVSAIIVIAAVIAFALHLIRKGDRRARKAEQAHDAIIEMAKEKKKSK